MLEVMEDKKSAAASIDWTSVVARVCAKIPPLWDLSNYVAVNPFLGFSDMPLAAAARYITDGLGAAVFPPTEFYRKRWNQGGFGEAEISAAARRLNQDLTRAQNVLNGKATTPTRAPGATLSLAELHDRAHNTNWNDAILRSISRWCAVYAEKGGSFWSLCEGDVGLYSSWRQAAVVDRTLEIAGLKGWRKWAGQLPDSPLAAIDQTLTRLGVNADDCEPYLYRLLGGVYGWASFFRRYSWQDATATQGPLVDLLAIRLCSDAAIAHLALKKPAKRTARLSQAIEDESVRAVFQEALEDGYVNNLISNFRLPTIEQSGIRPALQAVFCIDVRSEPFRRQLEVQSVAIETLGFAGFFGVAMDWNTVDVPSARCPVLLKPSVHLRAVDAAGSKTLAATVKQVQGAPAASFSFVETLGLVYGIGLAKDSLKNGSPSQDIDGTARFSLAIDGSGHGIADAARLDLAAGILTNMGLRNRFARIVLLCGHESLSNNNPHAASLDCGACGGHGGAINARVAAALLNDTPIRAGLAARGLHVPQDTWFVPGVHNTTIDEVTLLDVASVPATHADDVANLKAWLTKAGEMNRRFRAESLGLAGDSAEHLKSHIVQRARDWSEVRPEWGLAGNASFIAARRQRTRGVNLNGRTFLHEYDCRGDPDRSILTLILCAPMVVASWINLQYFASTVDNKMFGCGTKALHNRVGSLGVVLGNGGDLRTGLAIQSVHAPDGNWYHEPLRLQVIVEASPDQIEAVLQAQHSLKELVDNQWVRIFSLDPDSSAVHRRLAGAGWEAMTQ